MEAIITRWSRYISLVGLVGLLLLAGITVCEVMLRTLFSYPMLGVADMSRLFVTVVVASCFPFVSSERRHISVRVIGNMLGPRAYGLLEAFGGLLAMAIFAIMAWQLWLYADELSTANETTWILLWPVAPWWRATTVLLAFCVPNQLVCVLISLKSVFAPQEILQKAQIDAGESKKEDV